MGCSSSSFDFLTGSSNRREELERRRQQQREELELRRQQQRVELELRRQQQREELERKKQQQQQRKEQEEWRKATAKACDIIDRFIRTRRKFNPSDPLEYACFLRTIADHCDEDVSKLIGANDVSHLTRDIIASVPLTTEFVITRYSSQRTENDRRFVQRSGDKFGVAHLTPHQGDNRVFGYFHCLCGNRWASAGSWKDKWQVCKQCRGGIYPCIQEKLLNGSGDSYSTAPHNESGCQKCIELKGLCLKYH